MNEELLQELRTKTKRILRAAEKIIALKPQLTRDDTDILSELSKDFQDSYESITEMQGRVCGPQKTQW
jgi:hypothetical protein